MGWWAQTRARPLAGWVLAGELICAAGFVLNIVVVLAFFQYASSLDFDEGFAMVLAGLPWWAALGSLLAGIMLWGGALLILVASLMRTRIERRAQAPGEPPRSLR